MIVTIGAIAMIILGLACLFTLRFGYLGAHAFHDRSRNPGCDKADDSATNFYVLQRTDQQPFYVYFDLVDGLKLSKSMAKHSERNSSQHPIFNTNQSHHRFGQNRSA